MPQQISSVLLANLKLLGSKYRSRNMELIFRSIKGRSIALQSINFCQISWSMLKSVMQF